MEALEWKDLAARVEANYDEDLEILFANKDGYTFYILDTGQKQFRIIFSVKADEAVFSPNDLKQLAKDNKVIAAVNQNRYALTVTVKNGMTKGKTKEKIVQALDASLTFLKEHGFANVCEHSGEVLATAVYQVGTNILILSEESFNELSSNLAMDNKSYEQQNENVLAGSVGAFIGSVLGAVVALIIAQLGYVSFISGIVMGVCTIKGYELLGRKLSKKGVIISVFFMIVMTLLAHQFDYAFLLAREVGSDVFASFSALTSYILTGGEIDSSYWINLGLLLLFTGIGAAYMVYDAMKKQTLKYITRKL